MLNLSKFQKVAEDEKTVTMRHDDGHEMKILVKKLPHIQREQIKRLKLADGGKVQKLDDGTPDKPLEVEKIDPNAPSSQADSKPFYSGDSQQWGSYPPGVGPNANSTGQSAGQSPDHSTTVIVNPAPGQGQQQPAPTQTPDPGAAVQNQAQIPQYQGAQSVAGQMAQTPINVDVPGASPIKPNLNPNGSMNPTNVAQNSQQGALLQAKVNVAQGEGQAQIENAYQKAAAQLAQNDQNNLRDNITIPVTRMSDYISTHPINPNAYTENLSTVGKISTALGLILGGMGGKGQSNMAQDYLNNQIDRDVQGQRDRIGQAQTIAGLYQKQYGDNNFSNNLAKVSTIDVYTHQAKQLAAKLNTPQAWANFQQFSANMAIERNKLIGEAAVNFNALPGMNGRSSGAAGGAPSGAGPAANQDHILKPNAESTYNNLKYDKVHTPQQISDAQGQYNDAFQADKAIDQVKALWPQLMKTRTMSGFYANKIDPNTGGIIGGALGGGGAAMSGFGLPVAGGAAALGAGIGEAAAAGTKASLNAMSGQQGTQYNTAADALSAIIGNSLGSGLTPTAKGEIAKDYIPTWWDSPETAQDKQDKLINKIKTITKTGALSDLKMTNDKM